MPTIRQVDRPIDLHQLDIFLTIVSTGSMSRAAVALGISQSAVSQALAQLERSLGLSLVDRSRRPLALTSAGTYIHHNADHLIALARQLKTFAVEAARRKIAYLRIGLIDSVANTIGPALIKWLLEHTSGLSMQIGMAIAQEKSLINREVDLIISTNAFLERPEFDHRFVYRENFVAIVSRALAGAGEPASLQKLAASHPFIRYSHTSTLGIRIERILRYNTIDPPRKLEVDHADTLTLLVSQGLGWAITTPTCLLQTGTRFVDLIDLAPVERGNSSRSIFLVTRSGEFEAILDPLIEMVRGSIRNLLDDQPQLRAYVSDGAINFAAPDGLAPSIPHRRD
jgi:DNA-binding transcriptional LysR family regulator